MSRSAVSTGCARAAISARGPALTDDVTVYSNRDWLLDGKQKGSYKFGGKRIDAQEMPVMSAHGRRALITDIG